MKVLKKIYDGFMNIEKYFIFVVFFFATIMVVVNVLTRKFIGYSFPWLEELNRYILVVTTFIGAAIGVTLDKHARMDSIVALFKGRAHNIVEAIGNLIYLVLLAVVTYYGFKQLGIMIKLSAQTATLLVPVYVFYMFIPLGLAGMTIRTLAKLIQFIKGAVTYKADANEKLLEEGGENA